MSRGVIYPEDADWHERQKGCKLAFEFGVKRGHAAGLGVKNEQIKPLPFDTPERMAYYRGYARGFRPARFHSLNPRVDDEFRRKKHGT